MEHEAFFVVVTVHGPRFPIAVADCVTRVTPAGTVPLVVHIAPLHDTAAGRTPGGEVPDAAVGPCAGAGATATVAVTAVLAVPERSVMVTV